MVKKQSETVRGSGNIYRDFDVPDADVRRLKAILAAEIIKTLDKKGLSVRKAQSLTGTDARDFSRVRRADFRRISVERLVAMINGLGSRVEVAVTLRRAGDETRGSGGLNHQESGYESGYQTRRCGDICEQRRGVTGAIAV
ncbi:MAG: helix-turn-helix transcriptional regulator [Burkholderiales bacterium]